VNTTHAAQPLILFELNEVPYRVLDWYASEKPRSNIAQLLSVSRQCRTSVKAARGELNPIITWSSLHRGVSDDQHGVSAFGQPLDKADAQYPPIWRILADHGIRTGVFGSLLSYRIPENLSNYAFYFPEPLANEPTTYPSYLMPLQEFNLSMTRRSGRQVSATIDWKLAARMLPTLPKLGLTPGTCAAVARQLAGERISPHLKGRRRSIQSMLAFDVFMKQLQQYRPAFSTFFTNHVASAQHRFWAALFPEDFADLRHDGEWRQRYSHEIEYAMDVADGFLGTVMRFVADHPEYILLVGSSMGQEAANGEPNNSYLEINDFARFMQRLGLEPAAYARKAAMFPCYGVTVQPPYVDQFRERLASMRIDGRPISVEHHDGGYSLLDFDYRNYGGPGLAELSGQQVAFQDVGIGVVEDEEGVYLSGNHQPEGIFLIYDREHPDRHRGQRDNVSVLEIAPTVLKHFGIPIPAYMPEPSLSF
jgi:hypothetical protein